MVSFLKQGRAFYRQVAALSVPLVIQNLITSSLGMADTFMVGLLGTVDLAGVTLANIPFFVVQLFFFGVQSGGTVLISQYWGKGDKNSINRVLGLSWYVTGAVALTVALAMLVAPIQIMSLFGNDMNAVIVAARYGRIIGFAFLLNGLNLAYVGALRSMEQPKIGTWMLGASMVTNLFLNYVLIFGKLGAPRLGVEGAAIATLAARVLESVIVIGHIIKNKTFRLDLSLVLRPGREMVGKLIKYSAPVVLNETLWGLGTSIYPVIMGHMPGSTEILAAYTIAGNVDKLVMVAISGLCVASAVIIGKEIGAGRPEKAYSISWTLNFLAMACGAVFGGALVAAANWWFPHWLYPLFRMTTRTESLVTMMLSIIGGTLFLRGFSHVTIVGVLRGGGDVKTATLIDLLPLWLVSIPMAAVLGLWLNLGPVWVYIAMSIDQVIKLLMGVPRIRSRKWIHDVTVS